MFYIVGVILVLCTIEFFREGKKNKKGKKGESLIQNQASMIDYHDFGSEFYRHPGSVLTDSFGSTVPEKLINDTHNYFDPGIPSNFGSSFSLDG